MYRGRLSPQELADAQQYKALLLRHFHETVLQKLPQEYHSTDEKEIGTHVCTEEDFGLFYPPAQSSRIRIEKLKNEGIMMCLDWKDLDGKPIELYGSDDVNIHRRIDLNFLPCEPV